VLPEENGSSGGSRLRETLGRMAAWAAVALGIAVAARICLQYPPHPSDEDNYVAVVERLERGEAWPVSGPAFVWIVRMLSLLTHLETAQALPLFALVSAGLIPPLLFLFYRCGGMKAQEASTAIALLMTSGYFLAPLLEGRPQQWGMVLLLATVGSFQRLWNRPRGRDCLVSAGMYGLTFSYHILSFLVCNLQLAGTLFLHSAGSGRFRVLWLGLLAGFGVLFWSDWGPYAAMRQDMIDYQLRAVSWPLAAGAVLGCGALAYPFAARWRSVARWIASIPATAYYASLLSMLGAAFVWQLYLLPPESLHIYRGSALRFVLLQSGDLCYGLLFLRGCRKMLAECASGFYLQQSILLMALGAAVLSASVFLGDKNGMIRVMNDWMLFSAPVAVVGWRALGGSWQRRLRWTWPLLVTGSLFHAAGFP
jgi:hypothetical protein